MCAWQITNLFCFTPVKSLLITTVTYKSQEDFINTHLLLGNLEALQDHTVNGESDVCVDVVEKVTQTTVDQSILTKTIQLHAEPSHTVNVSSILCDYCNFSSPLNRAMKTHSKTSSRL